MGSFRMKLQLLQPRTGARSRPWLVVPEFFCPSTAPAHANNTMISAAVRGCVNCLMKITPCALEMLNLFDRLPGSRHRPRARKQCLGVAPVDLVAYRARQMQPMESRLKVRRVHTVGGHEETPVVEPISVHLLDRTR